MKWLKLHERFSGKEMYINFDQIEMKVVYTNSSGKVIREIKMTNFESITSSPEALAKWLSNTFDFCDRGCSHCVIGIERCMEEHPNGKDTEDLVLEWLKQESK
jgi:hypothetical protein